MPTYIVLQWGRTLSSAESRNVRASKEWIHSASMGPHSFKCGKDHRLHLFNTVEYRFNGAALFQVRKAVVADYNRRAEEGFNGAALFQVRKVDFHLVL